MKKLTLLLMLTAFLFSYGCGGSQSTSSPKLYAAAEDNSNNAENASDSSSTSVSKENDKDNNDLLNAVLKGGAKDAAEKSDAETTEKTNTNRQLSRHSESTTNLNSNEFYKTIDNDDSASAVDDDLWRQFDLAEEYHAMGVIANREAAWEEAQYYFEKSLSIMANLDVESDTAITPEATKYNEILDNVIADYRVTLRSLGNLDEDVSSAVLIERFGDLASRLDDDTMKVYNSEQKQEITYDIPIVMNERVKNSIVYFQTVAKEAFTKYLQRSKKYTPMMKEILREYGLPEDLIYLSLVESGYNPHAYSWARAMGLWQFISSTGRLYNLHRSWWIDERKDPIKSTKAAARFLRDLYEQFGSWELAMAAYNGGPGRVNRTIKKQKTIDFWKMKLRRQTMDYVPLIMAATIIAKNPEKYGFYDIDYEPTVEWDEVKIDKCLELKVIANEIDCPLNKLQELNPELLRRYTPPNTKGYMLKVPKGKKEQFLAAYDDLPSPKETSWVKHKISRGETVSTIASRYGVSQYAIFEANNLSRRSKIYAGRTLIVPVPLDREYNQHIEKPSDRSANNSIYAVQSGDTMWDIARAFGTTVTALRRANSIVRGSRIYVGQKLRIPSNAKYLKQKNNSSSKTYASTENTKKSSSSPPSVDAPQVKTYKVRAGDTLWDIARKFGTTTTTIRRLNDLGRSSRIYPGQNLKVSSNVNYTTHRVRRGETLSSIARKYRTSIARIRANNNIDDPDQLQIGTNLKIY